MSRKLRKLTEIVRVLPTEAHLQIVILDDQAHEPVKKMSALLICNTIDLLDMAANCENTLPPSDWVGADHRMLSAQFLANILGSSARTRVNLEAVLLGNVVEARLGIGGSQALEELLVWLREAVVDLITGSPQRI